MLKGQLKQDLWEGDLKPSIYSIKINLATNAY